MTYKHGPLIQKKDIMTYECAIYKIEDSQEKYGKQQTFNIRNMDMDITTLQYHLKICKENT